MARMTLGVLQCDDETERGCIRFALHFRKSAEEALTCSELALQRRTTSRKRMADYELSLS